MYMYLYVKGPKRDPKGLHLFHTFSYYFNLFQSFSTYFIECHTFSVMFILFHTISYYFQLPTTAGCHGTGSSTFPRFWWFFHGRSFLGSHQRGRPPFNFNTMGRQFKKVVTECGWDLHCSNRWMMKVEHMCPLIFSEHENPNSTTSCYNMLLLQDQIKIIQKEMAHLYYIHTNILRIS